jgi:hypothetical protein
MHSLLPNLPRRCLYQPRYAESLTIEVSMNDFLVPELQKKLIPEGAPIEIKSADEVAPMILALVDKATRDTDAFTGRDGAVLPW